MSRKTLVCQWSKSSLSHFITLLLDQLIKIAMKQMFTHNILWRSHTASAINYSLTTTKLACAFDELVDRKRPPPHYFLDARRGWWLLYGRRWDHRLEVWINTLPKFTFPKIALNLKALIWTTIYKPVKLFWNFSIGKAKAHPKWKGSRHSRRDWWNLSSSRGKNKWKELLGPPE